MSDQTLFAVMIFVVVLLLSQAFITPLMGSSAQARRRLRHRIRGVSTQTINTQISLARRQYLLSLSPLERRLESSELLAGLRIQLDQAGIEFPAYRVVLLILLSALVAGAAAFLYLNDPLAALMLAVGGGLLPVVFIGYRRRTRMARFEEQLPDGIGLLARSLRAGLPFTQSLRIAAEELRGPVGQEFGLVFTEVNYGGDLRAALLRMLERMPTLAVMAMVSSIMIQRDTGGNLAEVLERLEKLIRARFRFQRKVKTLTASNRMAAWVVSIMPFALAAFLELNSPGWVTGLTEKPETLKLVYLAFGMMIAGILWIRQMTKVDV